MNAKNERIIKRAARRRRGGTPLTNPAVSVHHRHLKRINRSIELKRKIKRNIPSKTCLCNNLLKELLTSLEIINYISN
jgi:hypothetical protein